MMYTDGNPKHDIVRQVQSAGVNGNKLKVLERDLKHIRLKCFLMPKNKLFRYMKICREMSC